jgi:hypothetical protein
VSLQRFLLVDVDDIFVGEKGTRLRKDDVTVRVGEHALVLFVVPVYRVTDTTSHRALAPHQNTEVALIGSGS